MIYGRKTVLRIIYILEKGRCHQFPSLLTELFLKANNTGLGTAGIDKFSLTNIIFLNLITFGHSIALIVLGEIICWSLLKIRINAGSDKGVFNTAGVFLQPASAVNEILFGFSVIGGFSMTLALDFLFYQTIMSFNVSLLFCKISFKTLD